jgi:hypothetical protein
MHLQLVAEITLGANPHSWFLGVNHPFLLKLKQMSSSFDPTE